MQRLRHAKPLAVATIQNPAISTKLSRQLRWENWFGFWYREVPIESPYMGCDAWNRHACMEAGVSDVYRRGTCKPISRTQWHLCLNLLIVGHYCGMLSIRHSEQVYPGQVQVTAWFHKPIEAGFKLNLYLTISTQRETTVIARESQVKACSCLLIVGAEETCSNFYSPMLKQKQLHPCPDMTGPGLAQVSFDLSSVLIGQRVC